jgi:hypothetical protein
MITAWGEDYFPYLYRNHPDPNYDPVSNGVTAWIPTAKCGLKWRVRDRRQFGIRGVGGSPAMYISTSIIAGDHNECDPSLSQETNQKIAGSKLVILPRSGHMTFADQPTMFLSALEDFVGTMPANK